MKLVSFTYISALYTNYAHSRGEYIYIYIYIYHTNLDHSLPLTVGEFDEFGNAIG